MVAKFGSLFFNPSVLGIPSHVGYNVKIASIFLKNYRLFWIKILSPEMLRIVLFRISSLDPLIIIKTKHKIMCGKFAVTHTTLKHKIPQITRDVHAKLPNFASGISGPIGPQDASYGMQPSVFVRIVPHSHKIFDKIGGIAKYDE